MRLRLATLAALLLAAAPAAAGEWLAGDLHVHTTYSHDSYGGPGDDNTGPDELYTLGSSVEESFRFAALRGLDFLTISDHNDVRSQRDPGWGAGGVLGVPAYENSLSGHAQMLGARRLYEKSNVRAMLEELHRDGGLMQANHPTDAGGLPDWKYPYEQVPVDTVEVWNLPWFYQPPFPSATDHEGDLAFGTGLLDAGHRVGFTGGSDSHWKSTSLAQGPGSPTTWVYAEERSVAGILDGLRRGRSTISWAPPAHAGPRLAFDGALPGDELAPGTPLTVRATGAPGATLRVLGDRGAELAKATVTSADFALRVTPPAGVTYAYATLYDEDGREQRPGLCAAVPVFELHGETTYCSNRIGMLALTSAVFFGPRKLPQGP